MLISCLNVHDIVSLEILIYSRLVGYSLLTHDVLRLILALYTTLVADFVPVSSIDIDLLS